jgi:uncharacterized membrane protein YqjE
MIEPADAEPASGSLRASVARLADALLGSMGTRIELATVEYAEERDRIGQQLALLVAGIGCLLFAVLFLASAIVAWYWDTHRFAAFAGVILVFAAMGAFLLWRRSEVAQTAGTPFAATLAELRKDRAALGRSIERSSRAAGAP